LNFVPAALGLGALSAIVLYQLLRPGHMRDTEKEPAEVVAPSQPDE
jgi:hypothetical protein